MSKFYVPLLTLTCLALGVTYHAELPASTKSHSVRPASTPVVQPAGCSCGLACECERLRDALELARNEIRTLKLQSAQVAVVKAATDSKVVAAPRRQTPRAAVTCSGGVCRVQSQPQRSGWYPGKNLRGGR